MADNDNTPLSPVKGVPKMDSHRSSNTGRSQSQGKTIPRRTRARRCNRRSGEFCQSSRCSLLSSAPDVGVEIVPTPSSRYAWGGERGGGDINDTHNFTINSAVTIFINGSSRASS
ncbi:PREDICTED: uncharacterized protein LOC106742104 [Dinoponera quadriceps]|uniref:Uncharacterized protein LOC106742104 n=1 Tax=Dinoponera quadriceps TaxID=609295 RepID=A0A6P3WWG1_DINQU|nr:PREDICTED: uncharacterized protein LOC106742104 [Dinoponera quadriceps]